MEITIQARCSDLPSLGSLPNRTASESPGGRLALGVQRGEAIVDLTEVRREPLELTAVLRVAEQAKGDTNFLGPYAKGTASERFFYLVWVVLGPNGEHERYGRVKVQLNHLRWSVVSRAADAGGTLTVELSLTDARGKPRCGSIRNGEARWYIVLDNGVEPIAPPN